MANKIVIAELDIDVSALVKNTTELKAEIDKLKASQKELTSTGQTASKEFVQNAADLKSLSTAYNANVKAIADQTKATADVTSRTQLLEQALSMEVTSIKEAREQNALLNRLRNEANATTAEGQAEIKRLNNALDANNEFIKENADQYLQQKINIGNYKDSIKEAFNEMNIFNGGITGFIARSQEAGGVLPLLGNGIKGVTAGIFGMVKASLAFIATPIGAIIAAVGLVLAPLINYLTNTQAGIDKVTAVTRPLQAIFQSLIGVLQNVGKFLFDAFSNPKQLLIDLADFVKNNIINRFKAFGVILDGIINLDFKKIADGVLQAGTGVENLTDKIKNTAKATGDFLSDAIQKGQELDRLEKELEKTRLKNKVTLGQLTEEVQKQTNLSQDQTLTLAEREAAGKKAIESNKEINRLKQIELDLEIAILKNKQSRNDTSREEELQLQELLAQKNQLNAEETQSNRRLQNNINSIRKEGQQKAIELENKRVDALIKKNQEELNLFIAQQGFKKKSTEQELIFNQQVYEKELKNLQVLYEKGKISKLQFETDKLNLTTNFAKTNADILIAEGERELEIIKENAKLGIDAKIQAELDYQALRLEQGVINEQQYQDAILGVQNEYDKLRQDKKLEEETLERQRKAIDIENQLANEQLRFDEQIELERERNEIKLQEELLAAEKSGADTQLIKDKYAQFDANLTEQVEAKKRNDYKQTFGQLAQLFGEASAIGKAFSLAQATISGYEAVLNAYTTAQKSPITALNPAYPAIQATIAGVFSGAQLAKIASAKAPKFATGGIQEIGGKRHSSGGTKFYGEDGTTFEAEAGEGIGILNRSAFSTFMDFNNRFGSGSSNSGFFQGGGIITQGVRQDTTNLDGILDAITSMPPPIVAVEEIQSVGNRFVSVQNTANLG